MVLIKKPPINLIISFSKIKFKKNSNLIKSSDLINYFMYKDDVDKDESIKHECTLIKANYYY